jgi:transposase InsO family protein
MGDGCDERHETLIETAFRMAQLGRYPSAGLLFHSDRGSQYTSDASARLACGCQRHNKHEPHGQLLR